MPVLVHFESEDCRYFDAPSSCSSEVYMFTEEVIQNVLKEIPKPEETQRKQKKRKINKSTNEEEEPTPERIPFYNFGTNRGFLWSQKTQDGSEHCGNEARAETEDSVYLNYAVVVSQ
jgi:hypothetical protein